MYIERGKRIVKAYLLDVGILLIKSDNEYEQYANVYDKKYLIYSWDIGWFFGENRKRRFRGSKGGARNLLFYNLMKDKLWNKFPIT